MFRQEWVGSKEYLSCILWH